MKTKLIAWLIAMIPLFVSAQTSVTFQLPKEVVTEQRLKAYGDSLAKAIKGTTPTDPVKPTLPDCEKSPTIHRIFDITTTGLKYQFDAKKVYDIQYEVRNSLNQRVSFGVSQNLTQNIVPITYTGSVPGTYKLIIQGADCKSDKPDEKEFVISGSGGIVTPPVRGDTIIKEINSAFPTSLNIYFHTKNGKRVFSDSSTLTPQKDYQFWYGINDQIVKTDSALKDFDWPANTPLGIWKAQPKKGLTTLAKWTNDGGDWFDPESAKTFPLNDSFPFTTFLFEPKNGGYDVGKKFVHWMDVQPNITLPRGNIWIMPLGESTPDELLAKGVTHFSKYSLQGRPEGDRLQKLGLIYDEVPKTDNQFNLQDRGPGTSKWVPEGKDWPMIWNERFFGPYQEGQKEPLTYDQGYQAGLRFQTAWPTVIFENSEQDHAVATHWPFVRGFYDAYIPRINAEWLPKGIKPVVAHNYFTGYNYHLGGGGRQYNKDLLKIPYENWPASDLTTGNLSKTTAVCFGLYMGAPDVTQPLAYQLIYASEVAKKGNKDLIVFAQSMHEFRPNNIQETILPDGKVYFSQKQGYNAVQGINYSFLAQCFTRGFIPFSASGKGNNAFKWDRTFHENDIRWLPNGSTEFVSNNQFPYWGTPQSFPGGQFEYYIAKGVEKYADTFAKVKDGKTSFLRFRLDGGKWTEVANNEMDDLVDAHYDQRGFVFAQEKDNKVAVFYLNSYGDNQIHKLEYEYKGVAYRMNVHSTIVHPVVHQL